MNMLCANVLDTDITSLVYETATKATLNATADLPLTYTNHFDWEAFGNVTTPVDSIFGWDENNRPPIFYKYPVAFNTILNNTAPWGRDSVYLLGNGAPGSNATTNKEYESQLTY
jgi:hypothetical protein